MKNVLRQPLLALAAAGLLAACPKADAQGFGFSVAPSASSLLVSNSLTYTINVTNLVGRSLTTAFVTNALPASVQLQSATPAGTATNYGSVVVFNVGAYFSAVFGNGQSVALTLTVQPTATGALTNLVTVASYDVTNTASTNLVVLVTNVVTLADLGVAVAGPGQPVVTGDWVTYSVTATNLGPNPATGVALTNTLPPGVVLLGALPANYTASGSNLIFNLASLAAGAGANFQFTIEPTNAGPLTLSASIGSGVQDTNLANDSASTNVLVTGYQSGALEVSTNSPQIYNPQNNLVEQSLVLTNAGTNAVAAARVVVTGLTNRLFNAVGTNGGNPFVVYDAALPPKQSAQLLLQFAADNYFPLTNSQLQAFAVTPPDWTAPLAAQAGTNLDIISITRLSSGNVLLWFPSVSNRTYTVAYSSELAATNWQMAQPPVIAPAAFTEWIDYGPPGTVSAPVNATNRFYRVFLNP